MMGDEEEGGGGAPSLRAAFEAAEAEAEAEAEAAAMASPALEVAGGDFAAWVPMAARGGAAGSSSSHAALSGEAGEGFGEEADDAARGQPCDEGEAWLREHVFARLALPMHGLAAAARSSSGGEGGGEGGGGVLFSGPGVAGSLTALACLHHRDAEARETASVAAALRQHRRLPARDKSGEAAGREAQKLAAAGAAAVRRRERAAVGPSAAVSLASLVASLRSLRRAVAAHPLPGEVAAAAAGRRSGSGSVVTPAWLRGAAALRALDAVERLLSQDDGDCWGGDARQQREAAEAAVAAALGRFSGLAASCAAEAAAAAASATGGPPGGGGAPRLDHHHHHHRRFHPVATLHGLARAVVAGLCDVRAAQERRHARGCSGGGGKGGGVFAFVVPAALEESLAVT